MKEKQIVRPAESVVGRAVGVEKANRQWYIAIVGPNAEKSSRDRLLDLGHEAYVASQEEIHEWNNGRRSKVERVVVTQVVFIHATETERRQVVNLPFIKYFMTDKAREANAYGIHPLATVSDAEMQSLRFMLYQADSPVELCGKPVHRGDQVKVLRGSLQGLTGIITQDKEKENYITVNIGILGSARVQISLDDIEILEKKTL